MSADAADHFHNGEVYYEAATRRLGEAVAMFASAAHHFGETGGQLGRRRAAEASSRADTVNETITAAKLTIEESRGYVPD